jgi:c-di-GMP-binding flagellar brake protein YcgR
MKTMISERRRHERIDHSLRMCYKDLKNAGAVPTEVLTANISEGGTSFESAEFLQLASHLVLEISLPTVPDPVKSISKVVWIRRTASTGKHIVGSHFVEMSKGDKGHMADFFKKILDKT